MNKTEIFYGNHCISNKTKHEFYLKFGIDIIDLFENIFKINNPYKDPNRIREKYVYGFNHSSNPSNLSYLKSIRIDDYKLDKDGKVLYMDLLVNTNSMINKYIIYFDYINKVVEVELNENSKNDIRYKYRYTTKEVKIDENKSYYETKPILSKVTLFNNKDESLRFSKIFTKSEKSSLLIEKDNLKYERLKYKFENKYLESYITMDIEDKESNRSFAIIDSERDKIYRNNFKVYEVVDSYMMMLNEAIDIESTLMLYQKVKDNLIYLRDNYKYEITIKTRLKKFGNLSDYTEVITDNNGVINLNATIDEEIKRKVKK